MMEVDQIYHLACPASPPHYQTNPVKTVKTNVLGTLNMLGLSKRTKASFLLASTSGIIGVNQKFTVIQKFIRKVKNILGMLIRWAQELAMTRGKGINRINRTELLKL